MSADFVQYDLGHLTSGSTVEITLDHRANVRLVDSTNFSRCRRGESFRGIGGEAVRSPVKLGVPSPGHWHVVIDLGGGSGTIRSGVRVLTAA